MIIMVNYKKLGHKYKMKIYRYGIFIILTLASFSIYAETTITVTSRPLFDLLNAIKTDQLSLNLIGQQGNHHHKQLLARELITLKQSDYLLYIPGFDDNIAKAAEQQQVEALSAFGMTENVIYLNDAKTLPDPHIWLSPIVTYDIVEALENINSDLVDGDKKQKFYEFINGLKQQSVQLKTPKWAVEHHAWGYLEQFFNFEKPLFLSSGSATSKLPKNFKQIQQGIRNQQIQCLIIEKNQVSLYEKVMGPKLNIIVIDPTGISVDPKKNSLYEIWGQYLEAAKLCQ